MSSALKITPRRSEDRGHADHGWLKTFHTWSFASYYSREFPGFGPLRVLNEDRVAPKEGFGTHSHREFEIFSYIISGELEHRDSMGNVEVMKRGDVQLTSAGTGISHSEKTHGGKEVHFLQIWTVPHTRGLTPKYYTRHFTDAEKKDKLVTIVAPLGAAGVADTREGGGPTPVHSNVLVKAVILSPGAEVRHAFVGATKGYVHVIQASGYNPGTATGASVRLSGAAAEVLREGDGAFVVAPEGGELVLKNMGEKPAEVLVFDIAE